MFVARHLDRVMNELEGDEIADPQRNQNRLVLVEARA